MSRAGPPRAPLPGRRLVVALAALGCCAAVAAATVAERADAADPPASADPPGDLCAALARTALPRTGSARRQFLQRLEAAREACKSHPGYLSLLGAAWLEEGEPARALVWLERALMLDPDLLGARADHALALAALGEPQARDELLRLWGDRDDVPPALRERMVRSPDPNAGGAGERSSDGWVWLRELTLLAGHESNLDQSPKLSEITITPPDGPVELPLENPLRPRSGAAVAVEGAWQVARSSASGTVWLGGVQAGARHAPGERDTDWNHVQVAASVARRVGDGRLRLQGSAAFVGGELNEPYRSVRLGSSYERQAAGCLNRVLIEAEQRTQQRDRSADGRTGSVLASTLCPLAGAGAGGWTWGLAARYSLDRPRSTERPGGDQRQGSLGLRLAGAAGGGWQLDAALRLNRLLDAEGYSPLLENGARRSLRQVGVSVEATRALREFAGALAVVQLQALRQDSNLAIFGYTAASLYGGLRWQW